jgi:hypothetical protein
MVLSTSSLILPNDQTGQMFFNEVIQQDTHGFTTGLAYDRAGGSEKSAQHVRHARRLPAPSRRSLSGLLWLWDSVVLDFNSYIQDNIFQHILFSG